MLTDESVAAFIRGESCPVEIGAIQNELDKLWQGAAATSPAHTRACHFNLLVYSPNEGAYERAASALAELMRRQPCRAIALIAEPEAEDNEISAYVSAHVHERDGKKAGCEQITIIARGNSGDRLHETATPLLAGNLPTTLWWQGDLVEENIVFEKLFAASRHVVFDSADGHDVGSTFSQARALNLHSQNGVCGDLNWLRLSRWRELFLEFMASSPAPLEHVSEVHLEVFAVNEGDAHFAQPFLLLGWLAQRLNWKLNEPLTAEPAAGGENVFRTAWQSQDQEVIGKISLRKPEFESEAIMAPGGILAVKIRFQQNGAAAVFSTQRHLSQGQVAVRVTQGEQTLSEATSSFAEAATADLLAQEMARASREADYENALRFATQLI
jgi:glucose-6-phosphate dehydrogenase assembly protein OpcA